MSPNPDDPELTAASESLALSAEHGRFLPGTVIGDRYRIVALAGRGGMGEVYRADDLKVGQPVALKFLPRDVERDPERLGRLMGEVRIARQVSHPNVCRVYDVGEFAGHHFITMEYVDGEDLALLLRRIGRLPQEKALDLARQICAGLAAAHADGIVHRDLKPANIMLDGRGRARITDFGLAAAAEAVRGKEAQSGTPAYMAPEQLAGGTITPRTDVYALGLVLYEMFTGKRPFDGSAKPSSGSGSRPASEAPSRLVPGLDPAIDAAISRCLESEPASRPRSAVDLLAMLPGGDPLAAAVLAGQTPSPEMVAAAVEEELPSPAMTWGLFGLGLLVAAAAIYFMAGLSGLDEVAMPRTPDALRERAGEIARQLGDDVPPRSIESWVNLDQGFAVWSLNRGRTPSVAAARPAALRFEYRQSPRPMVPASASFVTRRDPIPHWSGDAYVSMDPQGRLLAFSRIDRQLAQSDSGRAAPADSSRAAPMDWNALLTLTGRDVHGMRAVEPLWTPDVPADTRAAWVTSDGGVPIRLEAAAWQGKPVWFRTIAPWEQAERDEPVRSRGEKGFAFFVGIILVMFVVSAVLARHNLRLGRSDTRGALRVGVAVFLAFELASALYHRWVADPLYIWLWIIREPFFPALSAWLYYLAVEPFLRRRWPHRLIGWTRLLEGRFTDARVGREVLIGFLAGAGAALAGCIPAIVERRRDVELLLSTLPLGRAADFWGAITDSIATSLLYGLGSYALLLPLRIILRRDAAAWVGLGLIFALVGIPSGNVTAAQWINIVLGSAIIIMAARVGLIAVTLSVLTSNLISVCAPLTLDFSRWYAWRTGVIAALLLLIAVWGFRAMMGRRKILSASLLEG